MILSLTQLIFEAWAWFRFSRDYQETQTVLFSFCFYRLGKEGGYLFSILTPLSPMPLASFNKDAREGVASRNKQHSLPAPPPSSRLLGLRKSTKSKCPKYKVKYKMTLYEFLSRRIWYKGHWVIIPRGHYDRLFSPLRLK
jgi:hypothetical protein